MKTLFIRTIRTQRTCAPAAGTTMATAHVVDRTAASPLEQLRELDTQTCWPTHRIRNFLATQKRSVR